MPTVLILDKDVPRVQHLSGIIHQIDQNILVESFSEPVPSSSWPGWQTVDLVISFYQFPNMSGVELIDLVNRVPNVAHIPVLMMFSGDDSKRRHQLLNAGVTDLISLPVDDVEFRARCNHLLIQRQKHKVIQERNLALEKRVSEITNELHLREKETLLRLAKAGEYRDEETGNHVLRMAKYSRLIAEQLGLSETSCDLIEQAAPLHDIGKIGIPDAILNKPGRLTHLEFEAMKTHTLMGYEILKDSPSKYLQMGAVIALNHHEKYNGTGYPNQLAKDDIPIYARIVTIADAYDALTSERPYKPEWSVEKTIKYLNQQNGKIFDPECLDAFMKQLDRITTIQHQFVDIQKKVCAR